MTSNYTTLERVKRAGGLAGSDYDVNILRQIEAASQTIETQTRRIFIPFIDTKQYPWPPYTSMPSYRLWLGADLLSVSSLQTKAQDTTPTTIASTDYFLEPQREGPPYNRIEIDLSSSAVFEPGNTAQRAISVVGMWGYGDTKRTAGTLVGNITNSATSLVVSDASLVGVGSTLLIDTEQLSVTARSTTDTTATLNGALTATANQLAITVSNGALIKQGDIILIDSERMYVDSIAGNVLTVKRSYDSTTLASHANSSLIYAYRTLTVVRAVNGTTAAAHNTAALINEYIPPADIEQLAIAEVLAVAQQEQSGWGRMVGQGEGQRAWSGNALGDLRTETYGRYKRKKFVVAV